MVQFTSECTSSHHQHKGHNSVRKPTHQVKHTSPPTLATTKLVTPFISELPNKFQ